jgi:hypothetical protein
MVKVIRLDDIFDQFSRARCLFKIDTQGYEGQVLEAVTKALPKLYGVLLELLLFICIATFGRLQLRLSTWTAMALLSAKSSDKRSRIDGRG